MTMIIINKTEIWSHKQKFQELSQPLLGEKVKSPFFLCNMGFWENSLFPW